MLDCLQIKNFTAFREVNLKFSSGLNVIIGENSTGKTHLLKLGYLFCNAWPGLMKNSDTLGKQRTEEYFAQRIQGLFKPLKIGNLSCSDGSGKTVVKADVKSAMKESSNIISQQKLNIDPLFKPMTWAFQFSSRSETKVTVEELPENIKSYMYLTQSVYLPTKEIISFFDGFKEVVRKYSLDFDETVLELADNLSLPTLKDSPELLQKQLGELNSAIGGSIILKNGRFYLKNSGKKEREITLVSEGFRKIATLLHLIGNGSLEKGGTIFWDEPESNLNPRLVRLLAQTIYFLVQKGVQVVLATHSLFLLRELEILGRRSEFSSVEQCFFALSQTDKGVEVQQSDSLDDIDPLVLLDESLMQSDRFLEDAEG